MTTFAVEYVDDDGEIVVVTLNERGIISSQIPDISLEFSEPDEGNIGISVVVSTEDDTVYEGATYKRIAQLGLKLEDSDSSQTTAELFLAEPDIYQMLCSIWDDYKKEYPDAA